jgi:membrane-bound lytic murein transglycosylase D
MTFAWFTRVSNRRRGFALNPAIEEIDDLMTTINPRFFVRFAFLVSFAIPFVSVQAQVSGDSSARFVPNYIEQNDPRVTRIVEDAEKRFQAGQESLASNNRGEARNQFDRAVDVILDSGIDVRGNPGLQRYYLELVERIYKIETNQAAFVAANFQQDPNQNIGFSQQAYVPAEDEKWRNLVFTPEEADVTPEELGDMQIATTGVGFKFTPNPLIQQYINYYTGSRGKRTMELGLQRSGQYTKMARKIFREEGVPEDIVWLAQVESAWTVRAQSWAAAAGLWQFVPGTGQHFGLRQTAYVDERYSYEQATRASARYLKWLSNRYNGNWELAMGAYNTGEGNVDRAISRAGVADFWQIYPYIAQETRNYVPNILAVILIAKDPAKYGFGHIKPVAPMTYDVVQVPTATSLKLIADATGSSVETLRNLNPELRRDTTPRGEAYNVRIPAGSARQFVATLKRVPVTNRESSNLSMITVNQGEDWTAIAARTGFNVSQLQELNPGVDLKAAKNVFTPLKLTSLTRAKGVDTNATAAKSTASANTIKAQNGDTIAKIAARYGFNAADLVLLNGVSANTQLNAGRDIKTPAAKKSSSTTPSRRR